MKVLLIVTDLYNTVGGGQTVYKKIIEAAPNVQFYYFRVNESENNDLRPTNAYAFELKRKNKIKVLMPPPYPMYLKSQL